MAAKLQARIVGMGSYLPEKILSNHDLEKMIDTSHEWIWSRTGMNERRIAAKDESSSDMAALAGKKAIQDAAIDPKTIDLVLVATATPDYFMPSTAALVQCKLGATKAAAFDIQAACTGFLYGLSTAKAYIESRRLPEDDGRGDLDSPDTAEYEYDRRQLVGAGVGSQGFNRRIGDNGGLPHNGSNGHHVYNRRATDHVNGNANGYNRRATDGVSRGEGTQTGSVPTPQPDLQRDTTQTLVHEEGAHGDPPDVPKEPAPW